VVDVVVVVDFVPKLAWDAEEGWRWTGGRIHGVMLGLFGGRLLRNSSRWKEFSLRLR
jgi:hypothetical protein